VVGLRISFGTGWAAIIAAELVAARSGLGYLIANGMEILRADKVLVGMAMIGILGVSFDALFRFLNRRFSWGEE
jgi:ABC-type nitrate/sulfonate/bicarbonate transport system permease component